MLDKKSLISEENNILEYNIGLIDKEINKNTDIIKSYERDSVNEARKVDEFSYRRAFNENVRLKDILKNPYYGRLDIDYDEDNESVSIYIGRKSFILDNKAIIVSWAEPIADVYERFNCGKFQYHYKNKKTENDLYLSGNITEKRKIVITNQCVTDVFSYKEISSSEIDEDKLITEKLEKSETDKLGVILETIQKDQNDIIRLPIEKNILVQGCAGSGKSSVAFHRLAYLAYNYDIDKSDMLVISPNKIFEGYTSEILYELGTDFNANQKTFIEFAEDILGINIDKKYIEYDDENIEFNKYITSEKFKRVLDKYTSYVIENYIPEDDISIDDLELIKHDDIKSLWLNEFSTYKLNDRIVKFKEYLEKYLYNKVDFYLSSLKERYENNRKYFNSHCTNETTLNTILNLITQEENIRSNRFKKESIVVINEYIKNLNTVNEIELYLDLLENDELVKNIGSYMMSEHEMNLILSRKSNQIKAIDIIPLAYISISINYFAKKYRHIVIDECQDMSYIEVAIIENMTNSFTLVGDFNQKIELGKDVVSIDEINSMFKKYTYFESYTLNKSFRNSMSITNFSNEIIKPYFINHKYIPRSFNRETEKPKIYLNMNQKTSIEEIIKNVRKKNEKHKNIGIIFKDEDIMAKYYEKMKEKANDLDLNLIKDEESIYEKGINLLPARLSKGLEFDYVIIVEGDKYLWNEQDRRLLYVAATRALHELEIYVSNKECFVTSIDDSLWDGKKKFSTDELFTEFKKTIINKLENVYGKIRKEYKDYIYSIDNNTKLLQLTLKLGSIDDVDEFFKNEGVEINEEEIEDDDEDEGHLQAINEKTCIDSKKYNTTLLSETILDDSESDEGKDRIVLGNNCKELINEIKRRRNYLTGKQIDVYEYIINNLGEVAKLNTERELADKVGVSSSTISLVLLRLSLGKFSKFVSKVRYCIKMDACE